MRFFRIEAGASNKLHKKNSKRKDDMIVKRGGSQVSWKEKKRKKKEKKQPTFQRSVKKNIQESKHLHANLDNWRIKTGNQ